jgi:uncharacterized protein (TIGR00661 family)
MRYLFVVQGEGRGHLTQALSLKRMLEQNGHEVVAVMAGSSRKRTLPDYFTKKIGCKVFQFQSPNFMPAPKGKNSPLLVSILYNFILLPVYLSSILTINRTIKEMQPDVVINFYELMCGFTYGFLNPEPPMINVAHQYYFLTPEFSYTGDNVWQFRLLNFYSKLTAWNAFKILALSFRNDKNRSYGKIALAPPLLRQDVIKTEPRHENYIHGYLLNSGYAKRLEAWSNANQHQSLHFFWDKKQAEEEITLTPQLSMHKLSDTAFLQYMAGCKAYATTAGFESVCEAMYLQKPILMVPVHIEQECNAIDAICSNAGVTAGDFDLGLLLDFVPDYIPNPKFRHWIQSSESVFLNELTQGVRELSGTPSFGSFHRYVLQKYF